jgi:hypothetical protein
MAAMSCGEKSSMYLISCMWLIAGGGIPAGWSIRVVCNGKEVCIMILNDIFEAS